MMMSPALHKEKIMFARLMSCLAAIVLIGGCVVRDDTVVPVPVPDPTPDVKVRVPAVNVDVDRK